jgi:prepilin-type N-terminal cleavage/methylation domain-containing protein
MSFHRHPRLFHSAFTLVELIVVVIVLGLLMAVALPNFFGASTSAQDSAARQYLTISYKDLKAAIASNDGQPVSAALAVSALTSSEPQLGYISSAAASAANGGTKTVYVEATATGYRLGIHSASTALITLTADRSTGYAPVFSGGAGGSVSVVSAPVNSGGLPLVTGTLQVGQTLSATNGSWSGSPTTYAYQWQRCDSGGINCVNVGSNQASHLLFGADNGKRMIVAVTATNAGGSATASAAASSAVAIGGYVYVANYYGNSVSVIAIATNTVIATIAVGLHPEGPVVTPDGAHVYVTNNGDSTVSVIATATNTVVGSPIPVGTNPVVAAVTPDGAHVYVANNTTGTVSVIATATNTISATVTVGAGPVGLAVTPDGAHVYVANSTTGTVSVIEAATNTVSATVTGAANPQDLAISPNGAYVYVSNGGNNHVLVIATATNTLVGSPILVGTVPYGASVTPNGAQVYITNFTVAGTVSVIATATNTVSATVTVGASPFGVAVSADGTYAYVANGGGSSVSVIATATNTVIVTVPVGSNPVGVAVTP